MNDAPFTRTHLQPWYDAWLKDHAATDLLYVARDRRGEVYLPQVHFVRDNLAGLFWADVPYEKRLSAYPRMDCKEGAWVVGEHRSKSVRLPVYQLERPDLGLTVTLRDNYYDWNVSVTTEEPIGADVLRGFSLDFDDEDKKRFATDPWRPGRSWGYCYFQGFPLDRQFAPYSENPRAFSICLGGEHSVYTFLWLILRELRTVGGSK